MWNKSKQYNVRTVGSYLLWSGFRSGWITTFSAHQRSYSKGIHAVISLLNHTCSHGHGLCSTTSMSSPVLPCERIGIGAVLSCCPVVGMYLKIWACRKCTESGAHEQSHLLQVLLVDRKQRLLLLELHAWVLCLHAFTLWHCVPSKLIWG